MALSLVVWWYVQKPPVKRRLGCGALSMLLLYLYQSSLLLVHCYTYLLWFGYKAEFLNIQSPQLNGFTHTLYLGELEGSLCFLLKLHAYFYHCYHLLLEIYASAKASA